MACGWKTVPLENATFADNATLSGNSTLILGIHDTRQSQEYIRVAGCMQMMLGCWGSDIKETDIMELMDTDLKVRTYPDQIVRDAKRLGFEAYYKDNATLEALESPVQEGIPVIIRGQAWRWSPTTNESWPNDYGDGHYIVVIGFDDNSVYFGDSYLLESRGFMSLQEFQEMWHNIMGLGPSDEVKQIYLVVFIREDKPL